MRTMHKMIAVFALGAVALPQITYAGEYNKRPHLKPSIQAKVNRAIAMSWRHRGKGKQSFKHVRSGEGCGDQIIGDFSGSRTSPREVTIVAQDVIYINQNCRR